MKCQVYRFRVKLRFQGGVTVTCSDLVSIMPQVLPYRWPGVGASCQRALAAPELPLLPLQASHVGQLLGARLREVQELASAKR